MPISILPVSSDYIKYNPYIFVCSISRPLGSDTNKKKKRIQTLTANKFLEGENEEVEYNLKGQKSLCLCFVLHKNGNG